MEANAKFRKTLDDKTMSDKDRIVASAAAGQEVNRRMAKLLADLNAVLEVMKGLEGLDTLVQRSSGSRTACIAWKRRPRRSRTKLEDQFFDDRRRRSRDGGGGYSAPAGAAVR